MKRRNYPLIFLLFLFAALLASAAEVRAQSSIDIWNGTTSQGQRFTLVVENGMITAITIGVSIRTPSCSSFYTTIHHGNLGRVGYNRFSVSIDNEKEGLILDGTLGDTASGTLSFVSKPALRYVCSGRVEATWSARWSQQQPVQPTALVPGLPSAGVADSE